MFLEPEKVSTFGICYVVHLFDSKRQYHQHQIQRNKYMQHDMVKIRNKPRVTLRKKFYRMSKALVIAFQFFRTGAKYGVVFMAEKLQGQPKGKLRQKHPFAHRFPKKIQSNAYSEYCKSNKLNAFYTHAFHQKRFAETSAYGAT